MLAAQESHRKSERNRERQRWTNHCYCYTLPDLPGRQKKRETLREQKKNKTEKKMERNKTDREICLRRERGEK